MCALACMRVTAYVHRARLGMDMRVHTQAHSHIAKMCA